LTCDECNCVTIEEKFFSSARANLPDQQSSSKLTLADEKNLSKFISVI
jgi:hypothetical protein